MNNNNLLFEQFLSYVLSDALELNGALRNYDNYFNNINNMSDEINRLNLRVTEIDAEIERLSSLEVDPNWFEGRKVQFEKDIVEQIESLYTEKKESLNKISDIKDRFDGLFYAITPDESLSIKLDRMKNDSITKIKREIQELNVQYANLKNSKNDILIRFENNKKHMDELLAKNSITKEQYNESLAQMQNFVSDSQKKYDDSIKVSISSLYSKNDELVNLINFIESLSVEELISYVKNRNIQQDTDEKVDEKLKGKEDREESKNNETNYDKIYLNAVNEAEKRQQEVDDANKDYDLTSKSGLNDEEDWKNAYIESMNDKKNNNETNYDEIYLNAVRDAEKRQQEADEANKDYNLISKSGLNDEEEWKQAYINSINDKEKEDREESKDNETNYDEIYLNAVNEAKKRQQEVDEANKDYNLTSKSGLSDEEEWKQAYIDSMKKKESSTSNSIDPSKIKLNFKRLDEMEEKKNTKPDSYNVFSNQVIAGMKDSNAGNAMLFGIDNFVSDNEVKEDKEPGRIGNMIKNVSNTVMEKVGNPVIDKAGSAIDKAGNVVTKIKDIPEHLRDKLKEKKPTSMKLGVLDRFKNVIEDRKMDKEKMNAVKEYRKLISLYNSGKLAEEYAKDPEYYDSLFGYLDNYIADDTFYASDLDALWAGTKMENGRGK